MGNQQQFFARLAQLAGLEGNPTRRTLSEADFAAGKQTAGLSTLIASYRVPPLSMALLDAHVPIRLLVRGYFHNASVTGGSPEVFDLTTVGFAGIANPAGMTSVIALVNDVEVTPDAVNYAAATVSLTTTAGDDVKVYALPATGSVELRAVPPTGGGGGRYEPLLSQPAARLNAINQANSKLAPRLSSPWGQAPLGPSFRLELWGKLGVTVSWGAAQTAEIDLPTLMFKAQPQSPAAVADAIMTAFY